MAFVDLHCHTTFSDGHDSPSAVVKMAAENGVAVIGIADHDNLAGIPEAQAIGKELGVQVLPGVEMSTIFHGHTIHILGYGIPLNDQKFNGFLEKIFKFRKEGIILKMEKLSAVFAGEGKGAIDMDDFIRAQGIYFNREKAAQYLIMKGFTSGDDATFQLLAKTKIERPFPVSSAAAIEAVHQAGGLAIISHPFAKGTSLRKIDPTPEGQERLLQEMIAAGVDGLECYQSEYGPDETAFALSLAKKYDLLASAGSDWHGAICDVPGDITSRKGYYPEHVGGLMVTTAMIAPLLERLGVVVDKT